MNYKIIYIIVNIPKWYWLINTQQKNISFQSANLSVGKVHTLSICKEISPTKQQLTHILINSLRKSNYLIGDWLNRVVILSISSFLSIYFLSLIYNKFKMTTDSLKYRLDNSICLLLCGAGWLRWNMSINKSNHPWSMKIQYN